MGLTPRHPPRAPRATLITASAAAPPGAAQASLKPHDDTLMAGTMPLRCISCGQHVRNSGMHSNVAEKVVHNGLKPENSGGGGGGGAAAADVGSGVKQTHGKRLNQLVMATYPNGRAGALRPLGQRHQPVAGLQVQQQSLAAANNNRRGGR